MVFSWRSSHPPKLRQKIMLPNERFALECRAKYETQGLVVDATNGEFAHCPYPEGMGDSGYYLLHDDHQHQGILQSQDVGKLCFWVGHARQWLLNCDPLPDNYFELCDIYEKTVKEHCSKLGEDMCAELHSQRDELGRSLAGIKAAERLNAEKNEQGKSIQGIKNAKRLNAEKDEHGRSVQGVKNAERLNKQLHSRKNELGKSIVGVAAAERNNSQVWESTIDGFRSNLGNVVKHNKKYGWDPNARIKIFLNNDLSENTDKIPDLGTLS
jgi:hypothetical protein